MNVAGKTFRNNRTGETIKVIDSFEDIVILENKQRVKLNSLLDPNQFTEQIDPNAFFNNQAAYNSLVEKIKTIPSDNILDDSAIDMTNRANIVEPVTRESAIIETSEDYEKERLAEKYGAIDPQAALAKQNAAFAKLLGEEGNEIEVNRAAPQIVQQPVQQPIQYNERPIQQNRPINQPIQQVEDPIITMFKNTKRNVNFKMNVELSNKIPRLDFIEMMEDSYQVSIIDYLAEEFTADILSNPNRIRDMIKSKIKEIVYGAEIKKIKKVEPKVETKEIDFNVLEIPKEEDKYPKMPVKELADFKVEEPKKRGRKPGKKNEPKQK